MKCVSLFLFQAIISTILLTVAGGIPPIPPGQSQVQFAKELVHETEYGRFLHPESLSNRLHHFAFLEGDLDRPFAIHQQVQSQAFYRMMIERYVQLNVAPVSLEHKHAALAGKIIEVSIPMPPLSAQSVLEPGSNVQTSRPTWSLPSDSRQRSEAILPKFNDVLAYSTYDGLIEEFWRHYRTLFVDKYRARLKTGKEKLRASSHDFRSTFSDLPQDKKNALLYWNRKQAEAQYTRHYNHIFDIAVHNHVFTELKNDDSRALRRLSSFEASSSTSNLTEISNAERRSLLKGGGVD